MATEQEMDAAWTEGWLAGSKETRITIAPVPSRPATYPSSVTDPIDHFRKEGFAAAVRYSAGIEKKP